MENDPVGGASTLWRHALEGVARITGILAALAGVVYGLGAIIMVIRLARYDSPSVVNVIAQLPRGLLISAALTGAILPATVVAVLYALGRASESRVLRRVFIRLPSSVLLWSFVLTLIGVVPLLVSLRHSSTEPALWSAPLWLVVASFVIVLVVQTLILAAASAGLAAMKRAYSKQGQRVWPAVYASLIVGASVLPSAVLLSSGVGLTAVALCPSNDQPPISGNLVGESADRTYLLASDSGSPMPRLISYRSAEASELVLGPGVTAGSCPASINPGR